MHLRPDHAFAKAYCLRMSPDGRFIAGANASQVILYDGKSREELTKFTGVPDAYLYFSPDSSLLLAKSTGRKYSVFDLKSMELAHKFTLKKNCQSQDQECCLLPDNKTVVDLVDDNDLCGYVAVRNLETGGEKRFFEGEQRIFCTARYAQKKGLCFLSGFRRSPEHQKEYSDPEGKGNIPFYCWFDAETGHGDVTDIPALAANLVPSIAYAEKADSVFAYDSIPGGKLYFFAPDAVVPFPVAERIFALELSPDNSRVAVSCFGTTAVYSFPDMKTVATLDAKGEAGDISFSPDGACVLLGTSRKGWVYSLPE